MRYLQYLVALLFVVIYITKIFLYENYENAFNSKTDQIQGLLLYVKSIEI